MYSRREFGKLALASWPLSAALANGKLNSKIDGVWIGANPLVVCDVAAHAYSTDYPQRAEYVARFVDHIDWETVAKRYHRVDRM